jgi:CheY-like chemotaxis protein
MGGQIWIESVVGQGSAFHFTARFGTAPAASLRQPETPKVFPADQHCKPVGTRPSRRILLAEDNPVNQKLAIRLLEKLGYQIVVAANGKEVLATLEQSAPFALVLLDCQMPEMDGFETARAIRARELATATHVQKLNSRPHLPIVALTANAMQGDRERCLAAGMDDYLSKPINPAELKAVLDHWAAPSDNMQSEMKKNLTDVA